MRLPLTRRPVTAAGTFARRVLAPLALAMLLGLGLASCGGGRGPAPAALQAPGATMAEPARCAADAPAGGLVTYRRGGEGRCHRAFTGMDAAIAAAPPPAAPATPTRTVTATELFDWAERAFPQYFPSQRDDQTLAPYTYRYYPETQNHAAVSGDSVYVQGPVSGGALLFVGTLAQLTCAVDPTACGSARPCAAIPSWSAGGPTCTPNAGQPAQIGSGKTFTFVDTGGATAGAATYSCNDGALTAKGSPVCDAVPPRACNTDGLRWTVGEAVCTPNDTEPTQIASGTSRVFTDSVGTSGSASYSCDNGLLFASGTPSCKAASISGTCTPANVAWMVDGNLCVADQVPTQIANGASYLFIDSSGTPNGTASYTCRSGTLERASGAQCAPNPRLTDSFGGDGGAADGGAAGDGTAADGAPIVGGLVRVVDVNGRLASATTDAQGYFRVKLTGMQPPLLVSVMRSDGRVRRSLSLQPLRPNSYLFIAVTGLTDKIVSDLAQAAGFPSAAALTPQLIDSQRATVASVIESLRNHPQVRARVLAAGLDAAGFDPLHAPFRANGKGYDAVLDNLFVDTDESGATVIRSADCTAPTSWTVDQVTCTPDAGEETLVPSGTTIVHRDTQGSTRGSVGWQCVRGVLGKPLLPSCTPGTGN